MFLLLSLVACRSGSGGLKPTEFETVVLEVTESGGFDDGQGTAVAWALDEDAGLMLVTAMHYQTGTSEVVGRIDVPAEDVASAYETTVPVQLAEDAVAWPILGALLTDEAGAEALPGCCAAVLAAGDPSVRLPEAVFVASEGTLTLTRPDGPEDDVEAVLTLQQVSRLGPGAALVDATVGVQLSGTLTFPSAFTP